MTLYSAGLAAPRLDSEPVTAIDVYRVRGIYSSAADHPSYIDLRNWQFQLNGHSNY